MPDPGKKTLFDDRFRRLLDDIDEGYYEVDLEGRFTYGNAAMARMAGVLREKIPGISNRDYMDETSAKKVFEVFNGVYRTGRPARVGPLPVGRKDGTVFWVQISVSLLRNVDGTPIGFRGVVHDVTALKQSEISLRETNAQIAGLIQAIPDIVYFKDTERRNLIVNRAFEAAFSLPQERLVGKKDEEVLPSDLAAECRRSDEVVLRGGRSVRFEEDMGGPDGEIRVFETIKAPILGDDGLVRGLVGVSRDVTERRKIENARRASEAEYRRLFDNIMDGVYRSTPEGRLLLANPALVRMLGFDSEDELLSRDVEKDLYADSAERAVWLRTIEKNDAIVNAEIRLKCKDGRTLVALEKSRAVRGADGRILYFEGILSDITARLEAERGIRESEERFRGLFENSTIGLYRTTPDGRILLVNPALLRMMGYASFEELRSRNLELEEDGFEHEYPRRLFKDRIDKEGEVRGLESAWKRKDGSTIYVRESARAIRNAQGGIAYYEGTVEDITERHKAEVDLRASESRYRRLFESSLDGVYQSTLEGFVVRANPAFLRMFRVPPGEPLQGLDIRTLYANPEDRERFVRQLERDGDIRNYELHLRRSDGSDFYALASALAVKDESGRTVFEGILTDITALKKTERTLASALAEKDVLLKEIHHRVKNNMQVVSSLLSLQARYLKNPEDAELFRDSQRRIRAMALVHEKLYQSKTLSRIDFGSYIRTLLENVRASQLRDWSRIAVRQEIENIFLDVQTATPCGLIVNELVSNAYKYAFPDDRHGEILIGLKLAEQGMIVLTVKDDGVGLPAKVDPLQADSMGLQLVTMLVGQIDGRLDVDRANGTEFRLEFKEAKTKPRG